MFYHRNNRCFQISFYLINNNTIIALALFNPKIGDTINRKTLISRCMIKSNYRPLIYQWRSRPFHKTSPCLFAQNIYNNYFRKVPVYSYFLFTSFVNDNQSMATKPMYTNSKQLIEAREPVKKRGQSC